MIAWSTKHVQCINIAQAGYKTSLSLTCASPLSIISAANTSLNNAEKISLTLLIFTVGPVRDLLTPSRNPVPTVKGVGDSCIVEIAVLVKE